MGEFYSFGLSDGKAETRCTSRESNKPWKLGSRRGSPNLANNASKLSKGVVDRGCVKTGIEAKEKSILSSRKSKNSLFLPPPFVPSFSPSFLIPSKMPRDQRYYQNSRGIPSFFLFFFFFFEFIRMETRKEAWMLIGRNNFLVLGRSKIRAFENSRSIRMDGRWDWNRC